TRTRARSRTPAGPGGTTDPFVPLGPPYRSGPRRSGSGGDDDADLDGLLEVAQALLCVGGEVAREIGDDVAVLAPGAQLLRVDVHVSLGEDRVDPSEDAGDVLVEVEDAGPPGGDRCRDGGDVDRHRRRTGLRPVAELARDVPADVELGLLRG